MLRAGQRKELKSSIKKSWILDKAGMLFWQQGYHGTSMRDIADACDCKAANIYNYFKGKEDILFEVIKDITERAVNSVRHLEDDSNTSPLQQLRSFIDSHLGVLVQMKKSSVLISDTGLQNLTREHRKVIVVLRDDYDRIMSKVISRGIESGDFAVKDIKVTVYLISSVIIRSTIWFSPKGRLSADEVADIIFDFVYRGIKA
ncbi:MAG TPA: TetR/AcrR family transcriptional regulator [Dehalococcoidia bacterium]|nr:TetR/AcrR family transcriptional regulator [Dehalococcoidia bacterium]